MTFKDMTCVPCRGGVSPLSEDQARAFLIETPGWTLVDGATRLMREYKFSNFAQAQDFVNKIGTLAEAQNHHPDIAYGWGYAKLEILTHTINGLHQNDFILAAKIDALS